MKKATLLAITVMSLHLSAGHTADVQNYLNHSESFDEWDSLTVNPTLQNSKFDRISKSDSLIYQYSNQLNEWDILTQSDSLVEPWYTFSGWNAPVYDGSRFTAWDSLSLLQNEFEAHAYNKWLRYGRGRDFDVTKVMPWDPELSLSYIPFGNDVTASPAHNPKYTNRFEFPINIQARYYSDRIALTPYKEIFGELDDPDVLSDYIAAVLKNSFNIRDSDSPEETSDKMDRHLEHDVNFYSHVSYRPFRVSGDKGNVEMRVYSDFAMKMPGDLFGVIFAGKLSEGGDVDVSDLQAKAVTAFALSAGGKSVRPVPSFLKPLLPSHGGTFKKVISVDLITGLAYAELQGESGVLHVDDNGAAFSFHGEAEVLTTGTGLQNEYEFVNPVEDGFEPAGYGASIDVGFEIADDKRALALYFNNLGAMRWNNVKKGRVALHADSLDMEALVNGGGESSDPVDPELDSLKDIGSIWRPVGTHFTLGMVQVLHSVKKNDARGLYSRQLRVYGEYQQGLTPYPGSSFIPRIKMGIENDMFMGGLGTGYYMIAGGSERIGSGFNLRFFTGSRFTIDMEYNAYGSPVLYPKRGFGISAVTQFFDKKDKWLR